MSASSRSPPVRRVPRTSLYVALTTLMMFGWGFILSFHCILSSMQTRTNICLIHCFIPSKWHSVWYMAGTHQILVEQTSKQISYQMISGTISLLFVNQGEKNHGERSELYSPLFRAQWEFQFMHNTDNAEWLLHNKGFPKIRSWKINTSSRYNFTDGSTTKFKVKMPLPLFGQDS